MIRAECHSDDYFHAVRFDATPYFRQIGIEQLVALEACDWGGDYPADEVAQHFDGKPGYDGVSEMFSYLGNHPTMLNGDDVGFECHVHPDDAIAWIKDNRPDLHAQFMRMRPESDLVVHGPAAGSGPHWDGEPATWRNEYDREAEASPTP